LNLHAVDYSNSTVVVTVKKKDQIVSFPASR
jgi:hypothetical protein